MAEGRVVYRNSSRGAGGWLTAATEQSGYTVARYRKLVGANLGAVGEAHRLGAPATETHHMSVPAKGCSALPGACRLRDRGSAPCLFDH
jgi:hypothetical protein